MKNLLNKILDEIIVSLFVKFLKYIIKKSSDRTLVMIAFILICAFHCPYIDNPFVKEQKNK